MKRKEIMKRSAAVIIILYVFLLSIQLMGGSFKLFGTGFAEQLITITTNPFVGLFIGILATALVQSSSVTTAIIVGLTASGALTVGNAVFMIMGANLGTSITNTLVSLGHITRKEEFRKAVEAATVHDFFNIMIVAVFFPLEYFFGFLQKSSLYLTNFLMGFGGGLEVSSPLAVVLKPVAYGIQGLLANNAIFILILSLLMLFLSLKYFVKIMKPLAESEFRDVLQDSVFKTPARSFAFGLLLTAFVQSSSVSTSLVVPLAGIGILTLDKLFPYILGANIGTTVTALMASLVAGSSAGIAVALCHLLFNSLGSAMMYPFRSIPIRLAGFMADMSMRSRIYPIAYVASTFYVLPSAVIFLVH